MLCTFGFSDLTKDRFLNHELRHTIVILMNM